MEKCKIMFIRVSTRCNAGCFMCNYANNKNSYNVSDEQIEFLLEYMKKDKNYKLVRFTGGEPLLHPKITQMVEKFNKEDFNTSIITNGYLMPLKYKELIDVGLNQIIFSLDGSNSDIHDKLRGLNGAFNRIVESIKYIKQYKSDVNIRINTVASKYNINDLKNILKLLNSLKVDMWSIIPLKSSSTLWNDENVEQYINKYYEFERDVEKVDTPILLGYSKKWGGRTEQEVKDLFYENKLYHPNTLCNTVDNISFYVPDLNKIVPCNCASHRIKQIETEINQESIEKNAEIMKKWLKYNGPQKCTGCEPLNVYLAENPQCLQKNIFLF